MLVKRRIINVFEQLLRCFRLMDFRYIMRWFIRFGALCERKLENGLF